MHSSLNRTSGFSTLMALGTIGILLIIITGLASLYINEMKLSRISYDEIVAYASAEGAFEYGMLKVRNHREGFEDKVTPSDPDGRIFLLLSDRSKSMETSYTIKSSSTNSTFTLEQNKHLIIPLFVSDEGLISGGIESKKPQKNTSIKKTQGLNVSGIAGLTWTIIGMSGSTSVGITGNGDITPTVMGVMRQRGEDCYNSNGDRLPNCSSGYAEILDYFYDTDISVSAFLYDDAIADSYLMLYNPGVARTITISSNPITPFSLPEMTLSATAQKNTSLQVYQFTEDKSRYYEALKYGIYNN